jgi:outer membrane murein-binding lipoprotein Lpp
MSKETNLEYKLDALREERMKTVSAYRRLLSENAKLELEVKGLRNEIALARESAERATAIMRQLGASL